MKNSKLRIFCIVLVLSVLLKVGYSFVQFSLFQDRYHSHYSIEYKEDFITPDRAVLIALSVSFSFDIENISVYLDTYPQMNIHNPTYGVEIKQSRTQETYEGGLVSVKIDASTGIIKDISYGRYSITPEVP